MESYDDLPDDFDVTTFDGRLNEGQMVLAQMLATITSALIINAGEKPKDLKSRLALITEANTIMMTIMYVVVSITKKESTPTESEEEGSS